MHTSAFSMLRTSSTVQPTRWISTGILAVVVVGAPMTTGGQEWAIGEAARIEAAVPQEVSPEEADRGLQAREERLWEFYDEWKRQSEAIIDQGDIPTVEIAAESRAASAASGSPPPPDAPDGEIALERQQWEAR